MASTPGAAQELIAAADNIGAGSTSWINNMLDTSSPLELGIVGGAVGALVGPAVLSAVGPIGSALTLGGPLAELGMLEESIGNIFQATRWGSGIIAGGASLLEKAGLFNRRWNVFDDLMGAKSAPLFRTGGLSAEEANLPFIKDGKLPPYAEDTRARIIQLQSERVFIRVHGEGNQARSWMMRPEEIPISSA